MAFDSTTVVSAHNIYLERNYRTSASQRYTNSGLGSETYLIEDYDIAKTLYAQFDHELARIHCPTAAIAEISDVGTPRKELRHFYLFLPNPSFGDVKSVLYLDRNIRLRDALVGQTIYRYPMILVLRVGPSELDTTRYKLVEAHSDRRVHEPERADTKVISQITPKRDSLVLKEATRGQELYKCLKIWMQSAERALLTPDVSSVEALRECSGQLAEKTKKHSVTIETIRNEPWAAKRYFKPLKKLARHLQDAVDLSWWHSRPLWRTYSLLKGPIEQDLVRFRSLGHNSSRASPNPKIMALHPPMRVPQVCVDSIKRICDSFCPTIQRALKEHSEKERKQENKRKRSAEIGTTPQVSLEGPNSWEDASTQPARLDSHGAKRRLRRLDSAAIENLMAPKVNTHTKQEPLDQLEFGIHSARECSLERVDLPTVQRQRVFSHDYEGGLQPVRRISGTGLSPVTGHTPSSDLHAQFSVDARAPPIVQRSSQLYSPNLHVAPRSHLTSSGAEGPFLQQNIARLTAEETDGPSSVSPLDPHSANSNAGEAFINEDRRRLLEQGNIEKRAASVLFRPVLRTDTGTHEDSSYPQRAQTPEDKNVLTEQIFKHPAGILDVFDLNMVYAGERGGIADVDFGRMATLEDRPASPEERELIPEHSGRLSRAYSKGPAVKGRGSVRYHSSPISQAGDEIEHAEGLNYSSDPAGSRHIAVSEVDDLAVSEDVRSNP